MPFEVGTVKLAALAHPAARRPRPRQLSRPLPPSPTGRPGWPVHRRRATGPLAHTHAAPARKSRPGNAAWRPWRRRHSPSQQAQQRELGRRPGRERYPGPAGRDGPDDHRMGQNAPADDDRDLIMRAVHASEFASERRELP